MTTSRPIRLAAMALVVAAGVVAAWAVYATSAFSGGPDIARVDASLLRILPANVGSGAVVEDTQAEQAAVADRALGANVARIATAFVGDPGGANWAYVAVVDVRREARTNAFYADWQESFDGSACERAGGVLEHGSTTIAGRPAATAVCGGGLRTYHVRLDSTSMLISVSDLGDLRFGEQLLAGLRP